MKNIFVFGITLVLISGIASALPNPASTYCEEMGYQLVGEMCVFPDSTSCEQWAFYRGECGQNYVHGVECAQAGEHSGVAIQCCEGLDEISNSLVGNDGMCAYPIGAYPICSDCGNGICESWENLCSCPEDCLTYPGIYINIDKEKYDINDNMNIVLKTDRKGEWKINVGFYGTESDEIKYIKKGVILSEILELNVKLSDYDDFFKKSGEYGLQTSEHNAVIEGFVNTNSVPFTVNVPGKCFDSDYGKEATAKAG